LYDRAARTIIELVNSDLKPRDIATIEAFDNAIALDVAMGGSTNTILHTLAIARKLVSITTSSGSTISRGASPVCAKSRLHPTTTSRTSIERGGIHTILGELKRMGALTLSSKTVTAKRSAKTLTNGMCARISAPLGPGRPAFSGSSAMVLDPMINWTGRPHSQRQPDP
jgi:dihydroxy-acid dehydratase